MEKPIIANSDSPNCCATITTRPDTLGVVVKDNDINVIGGIGEKKSNGGTQWYQQDRIYDNNLAISVTTSFNPYYLDKKLAIRKLTPRECLRLMGLYDNDIDKISSIFSDAILYHLAGDSIVVQVLENIFKELL